MVYHNIWRISCHGEVGDCSKDESPNIDIDGRFYCDYHMRERRNRKYEAKPKC